MSFVAAVDHLHALTQELAPSHDGAPRRKFDLDHMRILAHALGDPQLKFPAILIAGTNGKGSTGATLAAILAAAGYRTGLYTSPHLARVTERIRVSVDCHSERGEESPHLSFIEIPEPDFARLYFQVDEAANQLVAAGKLPHHPSFFETLTALAFLYFAEIKVDIAILEVGMGGRLDATNIVEPILSVITDIALDHQEYLGSTIAAIAREKAGIMRPDGTLITLPQHPEANHAIGETAIALNVRAISATDFLPGRNFAPGANNSGAPFMAQSHRDMSGVLPANYYTLTLNNKPLHVRSPLAGEHQQRNIALAIAAAVEVLTSPSSPLGNTREPRPELHQVLEAGIAATSWPGRLEFIPPNLLLDVAHNPAGAWTLRAAIATLPDDLPRTLIFSCLRDKDLNEMAQILFPLFDPSNLEPRTLNLVLTPIQNPRAASLEDLLAAARKLDIPAHAAQNPAEALTLARSITPAGGLIIATGSIYLVGALREAVLP